MTDAPALPAAAPTTLSPAMVRTVAFGALAVGIVVCVLGYLVPAAPGRWIGGARQLQWAAGELSIKRGTGQLAPDGLVLTAADPARTVVVSLSTSFRSQDYPVIAWDAVRIPAGVEAALLWYSDYQPSRVFTRSLTVEAGRIAPATV